MSGKRQESTSDMGVISDTVLRLCSHISGKNHKLFLDNLFTNYKLLKVLKGKGIEVVGVFRSDRLYGADASLEEPKQFGKMKRGSMNVVTSERQHNNCPVEGHRNCLCWLNVCGHTANRPS
ncbi:hypothetical protein J6590_025842 [Homalodisca vitripennis]|nr:hypothetical protein J6590_025842 [Homalodisca vitripennis]